MKNFNIAIDGTSGVGKSTIADLLAEKYGMRHLDTGAMYRCVAYALKKAGIDLNSTEKVQEILDGLQIKFIEDQVYLNGEDVSLKIRQNDISKFASITSALPIVREKLVDLQRKAVKDGGFIVDGRDIGTVVLKDAPLKIFMSASAAARAKRRFDQNVEKGLEADYDTILKDIEERDYQDSHRSISPLKKAEDAKEIDTSSLSIEQVVNTISKLIDKL